MTRHLDSELDRTPKTRNAPPLEPVFSEMYKPPEEGRIWEWRTFGTPSAELVSQIRRLPIRAGLELHPDLDVYLLSETTDQNVKLRRVASGWAMKFKLLLEKNQQSIELYYESMDKMYELPSGPGPVQEAAKLLETSLPAESATLESVDRDRLIELFRASNPPIRSVEVPKVRSQYLVDGGWIELAEAAFPRKRIQSLAILSPDLSVVEETLATFNPDSGLDVMNYVEACRRWG